MLFVGSMIRRELPWFATNLVAFVAYWYVVLVVTGLVRLVAGMGASSGRNPVTEALGPAILGGIYLVVGSPVVLLYLVPYRIAVRFLGRPRRIAIAGALLVAVLIWFASPSRDVAVLAGAVLVLVGYAVILRLPGEGLDAVPRAVRGAVLGILLSFVWVIGSFVAVLWGAVLTKRGSWVEAGAIAIAGTMGPAVLLFFDLFRDGVPDANYLVTGLLLSGTAFGIGLLVVGRRTKASGRASSV